MWATYKLTIIAAVLSALVSAGGAFSLAWSMQKAKIVAAESQRDEQKAKREAVETRLDAWKSAAERQAQQFIKEAEARQRVVDEAKKRLARINAGQVSREIRIEDRYVYLPDNASCVVRVLPARDEPATIATGDSDSPATAILDVHALERAYRQCRASIETIDGTEGRVTVIRP